MLLWQALQKRDDGKLLVRTKKHENVLSVQMYQFTFRRLDIPYLDIILFCDFLKPLFSFHYRSQNATKCCKFCDQKLFNLKLVYFFYPHPRNFITLTVT